MRALTVHSTAPRLTPSLLSCVFVGRWSSLLFPDTLVGFGKFLCSSVRLSSSWFITARTVHLHEAFVMNVLDGRGQCRALAEMPCRPATTRLGGNSGRCEWSDRQWGTRERRGFRAGISGQGSAPEEMQVCPLAPHPQLLFCPRPHGVEVERQADRRSQLAVLRTDRFSCRRFIAQLCFCS